MASNSAELLPGQSPPISIITATDQRGVIIIITTLAMTFALISILLRLFIRVDFRQSFGMDDVFAGLSMLFSVMQSTAVFFAVSKGFGKTVSEISPKDLISLQKALYSSDLLYIVTLWLTKCSVAFLFFRLSPDSVHSYITKSILVCTTLLTIISLFIVALRCELSQPWIFMFAECTNLQARWDVVATFDILIEVALFSTSVYMVKNLQLAIEKKLLVIFAFGVRLPIVIPTVLRIYYLNLEIHSSNPTLSGVTTATCTQIQVNYAIIAATTPCLRPFMSALSTNYGAPAQSKPSPSSTATPGSNDYSLKNLSKGSKESKQTQKEMPKTRWDGNKHSVTIMTGDNHSIGSQGSKQMIIAKNTEWAIDFGEGSGNVSHIS